MGGTRGREEGGARFLAALGIGLAAAIGAPSGVGWESCVPRPPGGGARLVSGVFESLTAGSCRPLGPGIMAQKIFRFFSPVGWKFLRF